jgi:hypothetical protein
MTLDEAIFQLEKVTGHKPRKHRQCHLTICPVHYDHNLSLSITQGRNGSVVVNCFSGCNWLQVKQAIEAGIPLPDREERKKNYDDTPFWERKMIQTYDYVDRGGNLRYQKCRFEPKFFAIRHKPSKYWKWGMNGESPILYNLLNVIGSDTVFICEGEKNADVLIDWGLSATTTYDGASGVWLDSYTQELKGKTIYIVPDNDDPGMKYATNVQAKVGGTILKLPGLVYGLDLYDWMALGYGKSDFIAIVSH